MLHDGDTMGDGRAMWEMTSQFVSYSEYYNVTAADVKIFTKGSEPLPLAAVVPSSYCQPSHPVSSTPQASTAVVVAAQHHTERLVKCSKTIGIFRMSEISKKP
jgi:hypothetical protein